MSDRYKESERFFKKAIEIIPLASQTFSKSITQYPFGASPLFIEKAKGAVATDIDGNRYIDLVASLGAVTIGYADSGQNRAIRKQLRRGSIFSLPAKLEFEVADLLTEIIPSAEKIRFAKNGTDATSGAVRLARAFTGKTHIITCGYHGWQDWYVAGTSKNLGVPQILQSLVHAVEFGKIQEVVETFDNLNEDLAAVIVEPVSKQYPLGTYLKELREFCTSRGVLLIFDETVTGFRVSTGGAQELTGVTPDLSCFGKGIANGYPLAALVGKKEIMSLMSEVFLSGTFGGDTISLAAAKYTINKYMREGIAQDLSEKGSLFKSSLERQLDNDSRRIFSLSGHPSWLFHNWNLPEGVDLDIVKTYFLQEILKRGVMALSTINVMHSLTNAQINRCTKVYSSVMADIAEHLDSGWLQKKLEAEPIRPLFKLRNV